MEILTSPANPRIRHAVRLRSGRYRRKAGQFVVDGLREIRRAIEAQLRLVELFVEQRPGAAPPPELLEPSLGDGTKGQGRQVTECLTWVAPAAFKKLAYGDRNEGLVAVFETPDRSLEQLQLPAEPLILVADQVEKPGNLGAILRSADAAGVDAVICSDCATDLFHPNLIRASTATVFSLPVARCDAAAAQAFLRARGVRNVAARVDARQSMWDCDLSGPLALVVGAEAEGLGNQWQCEGVTIPMGGRADSLNVSVAAAVLAFEARRQRR
ncbi:TrmH family RNA methyltransferase [Roseimaritima ulvae]|uniref:23S rRNA (Uridine(2479)-2'-O)-methyltransferase n=1 Tax=Roseimaritima ulvae TaxID=980254 RepID=A0A5B9R2V9_9BACT|nr:TrmH family RNA methyltransferase [Roseimaritima ulvae]QEG43786.1 23S rRNA (uridine(2479)-2'-O)-methyltransferase [Roseimaritima ulvae]